MIALAPIWIAAAVSLAKGIYWIAQHRASGAVFPPTRVIEVRDELPF